MSFSPDPAQQLLSAGALERAAGLRRMKAVALGLLILLAVVFVVAFPLQDTHPVWGYVRAAAEGGMVGALADWFAVTALFRHPMGVPVPHTALIPRKKDQLGAALTEFVQENFLDSEVAHEKVDGLKVAEAAGGWLRREENAARTAREIATAARGAMAAADDDAVQELLGFGTTSSLSAVTGGRAVYTDAELAVIGEVATAHGARAITCRHWAKGGRGAVALADAVAAYAPDWVVCSGFMRILGAPLLERFEGCILNTHPALLPSFPGAHGVRDALAHGVKVTGCTVHVVDAGVDTGPILAQAAVPVLDTDTEAELHERIKVQERALLLRVLGELSRR